MNLSETIERKFEEVIETSDWEVLSHDGWRDVESSNLTIPYEVYELQFDDGTSLKCADDHIIIDEFMDEVFAKDSLGKRIKSKNGLSTVISVIPTGEYENMYDLTVDGDHLYYTDGILSHNTSTFAADIMHDIIFTEDYKVALSSYNNSAVLDFMTRIQYIYENLPFWLKPACVVYNKFSIRFDNNSSVFGQVCQPNFCRGKTVQRIILDELAFVDAKISEELMASLLPSISGSGENSKTRLNIISTPNGTIGAFYDLWSNAIIEANEFRAVEVKYEEIPGRTPEFEKSMLKSMSRDKFDQEFRNMFISSSGTLVNSRYLESIQSEKPCRYVGDLELFCESFRGRKVGIACDPSEGVGEDSSAIEIFDLESFEQLGEYANNMVNQRQLVTQLVKIIKLCVAEGASDVYFCYESNGVGSGMGLLLDNVNDSQYYEAMMINDPNRIAKGKTGMATTNKTKLEACGQFKDLMEMGRMHIKSQKLINELKTYIKTGASFAAQSGNHDDRVSATLLFVRMLYDLRNYEDSVDTVVSEMTIDMDGDGEWADIYF